MSKNSIYTFDYFQPEEYRFSLDSVFMAQVVAKKYENYPNLDSLRILDLCSGCGIIGLELSIHLSKIMNIDFLEIQEIYREYFENNLKGIHQNQKTGLRFVNQNYEVLLENENKNLYDLIVCNPPYFFKGEGLLSPSEFKNRCRFFIDSDFTKLILAVENSLKVNAEAFILARPGVHHGRDTLTLTKEILKNSSADIFDNVRGTDIIRIMKKA